MSVQTDGGTYVFLRKHCSSFPLVYGAHSGILGNRVTLKPVLGVVRSTMNYIILPYEESQ